MRILFVCHGNICRSPMAEFVMKDLLRKAGREGVEVASAALHTDELGSDIHRGTRRGRHMEAVTSRPMLMGIVGRIVASGRKRYMHLTSTHADAAEIRESLERIGAFLGAISATAPQLGFNRTWALILKVAFRKWLGGKSLDPLFDGDQMLLRLSG